MIREIERSDLKGLLELYMQLHDNPEPSESPELLDKWNRILDDNKDFGLL